MPTDVTPVNPDEYIPLSEAVLCVGCQRVYRLARPTCPCCDDAGRISLARVLNRPLPVAERRAS